MQCKKEIRIIAQRRSGQHAIVFWIISQINGPVYYINNITRLKLNKSKFEPFEDGYRINNECYLFNIGQTDAMKENISSLKDKELFILNAEEENLKDVINKIESSKFYPKHSSKEKINILILRDPYNFFASRLKAGEKRTFPAWANPFFMGYKSVKQWIKYAKEFLGLTSYLEDKIILNYNKWVCDIEYRRNISKLLGLEFKDKITKIYQFGGGSSFDKIKYTDNINDLKVLERWKHYKTEKHYLSFILNKKIAKLS